MDNDFKRLLTRHLERQRRHYSDLLDHERNNKDIPDALRIAALEDALDDIETIVNALGKMGT
jgi:hypothetical protein